MEYAHHQPSEPYKVGGDDAEKVQLHFTVVGLPSPSLVRGPMTELQTTKFLGQGGLRILAETLHAQHGNVITCPACPRPEPPARAYCKDEGGNGGEGGRKRRQFRCRRSTKQRKATGRSCPINSCATYVKRAIAVLGEDKVEESRKAIFDQLSKAGEDTTAIVRRIRVQAPTDIATTADSSGSQRSDAPTAAVTQPVTLPKRSLLPRPTPDPKALHVLSSCSRDKPASQVGRPTVPKKRRRTDECDERARPFRRFWAYSPTIIKRHLDELAQQSKDVSRSVQELQFLLFERESSLELELTPSNIPLDYTPSESDWEDVGVLDGSSGP
jgi:hypothetical protein